MVGKQVLRDGRLEFDPQLADLSLGLGCRGPFAEQGDHYHQDGGQYRQALHRLYQRINNDKPLFCLFPPGFVVETQPLTFTRGVALCENQPTGHDCSGLATQVYRGILHGGENDSTGVICGGGGSARFTAAGDLEYRDRAEAAAQRLMALATTSNTTTSAQR
jgi:hypothetical protein